MMVKFLIRLLKFANQYLIWAIPATMLLGFGYGMVGSVAPLKSAIIPFTFLMVYPMMVTLDVRQAFRKGDGKTQLLAQALNFLFMPFVSFGLGLLFFPHSPAMALGLLLAGLVPTSGMTISYTGFAKGNMIAAIKITVIGLLLGSALSPFYIKALMGATIPFSISTTLKQMVWIVFMPMAMGMLTRTLLLKKYSLADFKQSVAPNFPPLSTLGVLGIVFIAIALKARSIAENPMTLLYILVPVILLYAINYVVATWIGRKFLSKDDAVALVFGSVMRNLSIALAMAVNVFGKEEGASASLVIAAAYIVQVQSAAWYIKLMDRIFPRTQPPISQS